LSVVSIVNRSKSWYERSLPEASSDSD
jgi:hypothetical protein